MLQLPGFDIGDVWPFYHEESGLTHLYFLMAASGSGRHWSIGHASGRDLRSWRFHGVALEPGKPGAFDDLGLATGSVIRHDGKFFMAYTGHSKSSEAKCCAIGMAVSHDLHRWERAAEGPVAKLDPMLYESEITGSRPFLHWRDPFLIHESDGFHMLLCARRLDGPVKTRGSVAHLFSEDLLNWRTLPSLEVAPFCEEMECPLAYKLEGLWHLLFSTHSDLIDPEAVPGGELPRGGLFCQVSERLTGPYRISGCGRIDIDCEGAYLYASQLIARGGGLDLIGTVHRQEESYVSDPFHVELSNGRIVPAASRGGVSAQP